MPNPKSNANKPQMFLDKNTQNALIHPQLKSYSHRGRNDNGKRHIVGRPKPTVTLWLHVVLVWFDGSALRKEWLLTTLATISYVDMQTESAEFKDSVASKDSKYHPLFSFDADVVLASRDGVLFCVPSMTLKMTSAWFRTMFTLPQGSPPSSSQPRNGNQRDAPVSSDTEVIGLDEDASTLEALFRMICGFEIPMLDTWDAVEPVLYAAEKYDMPGPASIMRALLRTPTFVDAPLRLYAAACHFGWAEDARAASTLSLTLNLYDPVHRPSLLRLRTADLYALFALHHERRMQFRARIVEAPFLTDAILNDTAAARCSRCRDPISYFEWRELRQTMLAELERRPAGDTVLTGLEEWPTALACWKTKCKKMSCSSSVYDKALSSKAIKDVLDALPNAIEVPVYETA